MHPTVNPTGPVDLRILGVDLAWGERRPDGVCVLEIRGHTARITCLGLTYGDAQLLDLIDQELGTQAALLMVDGPLICPNLTGARPVDVLSHVHFRKQKCGCHPTNATRCPRPLRVAAALQARGYELGWALPAAVCDLRLAAEVYPHPALVRFFDLSERIAYKRGPVAARRTEFQRLQALLSVCLKEYFPGVELSAAARALLSTAWTKDLEDQTDALICALIGYWHWHYRGARTQVLGDRETGFFLIPQP